MPADGAPAPALPPTPAVGSRVLLQSPPPAFPLGSNDDQLEGARARAAARAASVRHRSLASSIATRTSLPNLLNRGQVMDLFHNCIKLPSENKINQKNTWELGFIDHLSEIIQVGDDDDDEINFQKASCTLEAGVKIYSFRVDSVHSEAYKVLGGINSAGRGEEADLEEGGNAEPAQDEGVSKKYADRRLLSWWILYTIKLPLSLMKVELRVSCCITLEYMAVAVCCLIHLKHRISAS